MNPKPRIFKTFSIFLLLSLALSALGGAPVHAAQGSPESAPPAGLSIDDWSQIWDLLRGALPAQQAYLKASNIEADDNFSWSIAISGNTVVVGVIGESSNATGVNGNQGDNSTPYAGAAYVFTRSGTTWSQQAYLKASNTDMNDQFGISVAISGNTLVVGAYGEDSSASGVNGNQDDDSVTDSGAAYVFTRVGTTWSQQAYLKASNTDAYDRFGFSVAISGDTLAVGTYLEDSNATGVNGNQADNSSPESGAAYVFTRSGTNWSQQAYLKASNTDAYDNLGTSVAISGDTVVVGAYAEASSATGVNGNQSNNTAASSGAAYVFIRSGTFWSQQAYLKASNTGTEDYFGVSAAISGDTVVVGAYQEDSNATGVNGNQDDNSASDSGAAYVFIRGGTTWSQQAYLKASNTDVDDRFGSSVAVSGDTVVVGAPNESSAATGVNGNQNDNSVVASGAAYVFIRSGMSWSQQAYLKASNTGASDVFGTSVAISGNTLAIGAYGEDSNATGVNGNQNDNSATDSGAAYAFIQKSTSTFRSVGAYDGSILESGEDTNAGGTLDSASTTFRLGDDVGDKQYRAILSFNTTALPDTAVITRVTLKIKRPATGYLIGNNSPFAWGMGLKVDVCRNFFGTSAALQLGDFNFTNATNCKLLAGAFGGTPVASWYSANILSTAFTRINRIGTTQFRLRFAKDDNNDNGADYVKFYSGNYATATSRPRLVIEYYIP